jgi:hypothetical protein
MDHPVRGLLATRDPATVDTVVHLFDFVQFLLADDANLTPSGTLDGPARERLRARIDELLAAEDRCSPPSG